MLRATQVSEHLEQTIGLDGAPRSLKNIIEQEMAAAFGLPAIKAAELAERQASSVAHLIRKRSSDFESRGLVYPLTLVGMALDQVCGACYVLPGDGDAIKAMKRQRLHTTKLHEVLRSLNFADFERFGARILHELGAKNARITPHAGDQGIDFYGQLSVGDLQGSPPPFLRLAHDVRVAIVGQAKHYPSRTIGPDVVRELVGALSLVRTKTFSKERLDLFEDVQIRPLSPVLAMLFTTGELSSGAVQLAAQAGVIARNGSQLSVFLADRGVGMNNEMPGPTFSSELFEQWLRS